MLKRSNQCQIISSFFFAIKTPPKKLATEDFKFLIIQDLDSRNQRIGFDGLEEMNILAYRSNVPFLLMAVNFAETFSNNYR